MKKIIVVTAGVLSAMLASTVASGLAFAQAGSTGGSVGKTDKSLSGGTEALPRRQSSATPNSAANTCRKVVGTWAWHYPLVTTETVFKPDGTATNSSGLTNSWRCSGGLVIAKWSHGATDHIRISGDGNRLIVTTADCGGVPLCSAGTSFPATRK